VTKRRFYCETSEHWHKGDSILKLECHGDVCDPHGRSAEEIVRIRKLFYDKRNNEVRSYVV
jgi:hypothetical protein